MSIAAEYQCTLCSSTRYWGDHPPSLKDQGQDYLPKLNCLACQKSTPHRYTRMESRP